MPTEPAPFKLLRSGRFKLALEWIVYCIVPLALCVAINADHATSQVVRRVDLVTLMLGPILVVAWPIVARYLAGRQDFADPQDFFFGLVKLCLLRLANAHYGDQLTAFALDQPEQAAALVISAAMLASVTRGMGLTAYRGPYRGDSSARGRSSKAAASAPSNSGTMTVRDSQLAAAHEASHALVYGALRRLPEGFAAQVRESGESLGYITGISEGPHKLASRAFVELEMLMLLAGRIGERELLGFEGMGTRSDYARWLRTADNYLANGLRGQYFAEPEGDLQQRGNKIALDELQREQESIVEVFLRTNRDVLEDLQVALLDGHRLGASDLQPYIDRLQMTAGFPDIEPSAPADWKV